MLLLEGASDEVDLLSRSGDVCLDRLIFNAAVVLLDVAADDFEAILALLLINEVLLGLRLTDIAVCA